MDKKKVALIKGPFLRPNGVLPWVYLNNNYKKYEVTAFESNPSRFNTNNLDLPVRDLHWLDGKFTLFNYDYFFSKLIKKLHLPANILIGLTKITKNYDIIHTCENFNFFTFQIALLSRFYKNKKFLFSTGENIPYPLFQRNILTWQIKKFNNKYVNKITTTTELGKRALIHEGVQPKKVEVLPNALNFKLFENLEKDPQIINLSEKYKYTFNILFVHKLCEQKGTYFLIKAFNKLNQEIDNIRLFLLGENQLNDKYNNIIKSNKNIIHIDYIRNDKIKYLYNLSDLFILPSITMTNNEEQFGMAILEAMACGIPSIVTNVGGMPFVVEKNKTSLIIQERSTKDIIKSIKRIYYDKRFRKKLGNYSYKYVRDKYSMEKTGGKLNNIYEGLY